MANLIRFLYSQASDYLNAETAGNVITQDMVNRVNLPLLFPHTPIKREGFNCYRLLVLAESSPRGIQVSAYYPSVLPLNIDHPLYIIDYDDQPNESNQLWFFVSIVLKSEPETRDFLISFISKFGFILRNKPTVGQSFILLAEPVDRNGRPEGT